VANVTSSTANGIYGAGSTISIQVGFSETVNVTGTPLLALNSGGTASFASGSGTSTLTFTYTVASGEATPHLDYPSTSALSLNGGTIKDSTGNPANLTLPADGSGHSLADNTTLAIVGPADHLVFAVQPGNGVSWEALTPAVKVLVVDQYGTLETADNSDLVTLTVASGPGTCSAGSTTTVTVSGGVATFSNLALTAAGTYTLGETATGGLTGANSASFSVSPEAIALAQAPQINGDLSGLSGTQRSRVNDIVYTFNHPVTLGANAFSIALHANVTVNGTTGQTAGTLPTLNYSSPDGGFTWVVTFNGDGVVGGSIADGVYDITLNAGAVSDADGQTLSASRTDTFFRLYGDSNGDGRVNNTDLAKFSNAFGTVSTNPGYLTYFDFNNDGRINNTDLAAFSKRFGNSFLGFTPTI
jgi:hypothetical protein